MSKHSDPVSQCHKASVMPRFYVSVNQTQGRGKLQVRRTRRLQNCSEIGGRMDEERVACWQPSVLRMVKGLGKCLAVYIFYHPMAVQHIEKTSMSTGLRQLELGSRKEHVEGRLCWANRVDTGKSMTQSQPFPPNMTLRQNLSRTGKNYSHRSSETDPGRHTAAMDLKASSISVVLLPA